MRTSKLRPGDTVEVDIRGWRFPARVLGFYHDWRPGWVQIEPLSPSCGYKAASPRQVRRRLDPPPRKRRRAP